MNFNNKLVASVIEKAINERRDNHSDSNNCCVRVLVNTIFVLKIISKLLSLLTFWSRMEDCSQIIVQFEDLSFFQQIFDWCLEQLLQLVVQFYLKWRKKRTIVRKIANFL